MKFLKKQEANSYLNSVGLAVGEWGNVVEIADAQQDSVSWVNHRAPERALELYNFSEHVAEWLPRGKWKILQIDDSNCFDKTQLALIARLLGCHGELSFSVHRTLLFEFSERKDENNDVELLLANLIHCFLLFEGHCYLVSSNRSAREYLGIQDGYAYFYSGANAVLRASTLIENFERNPLTSPQWVNEIIAADQV